MSKGIKWLKEERGVIQLLIKDIITKSEQVYYPNIAPFYPGVYHSENVVYVVVVEYVINGLEVNAEIIIPQEEVEGVAGTREGLERFLIEKLFGEVTE